MKFYVAILVLLLAGCEHSVTKPVNCHVSAVCGTCAPLPDWDGDLATTIDTLAKYGAMYSQCADRAQACHECIDRLRKAKVIE